MPKTTIDSRILFCVFIFLPVQIPLFVFAQDQTTAVAKSDLRAMESLINDLAKQFIPHRYEKKKDWGSQSERWDGLHVQLKGLRLKTKRRKKLVNHGTWKIYSAELSDPK